MNTAANPGRLTRLTDQLRARGVKPLVPFLTAGYPDEATFDKVLAGAAAAGCPLVEIGIPFSDPVADGPVIQASSQRTLANGMTLARTLELAADAVTNHDLAVVLMGYLNPVLHLGPARFASACGAAGVAGVIIPDLPPEESAGLRKLLAAHDVDLVDLVAPTTSPERLAQNAASAGGFIYLISTTGVTGSGANTTDTLPAYVARVRDATTRPLFVGFGIATVADATAVAAVADGAIVGSALIRIIDEAGANAATAATNYLTEMAHAMSATKGSTP